jgi:prevent-host-death family protein
VTLVTLCAMTSISIKELHERTGHWLRRVTSEREVIVTERGKPVARMLPPAASRKGNPFLKRKLLPGVARLILRPHGGPDSADVISDGREGR